MLHNNYTQEEYKSYHVILPASEGRGELILGDLNAATDQDLIQKHHVCTIITAATGLQHLQIPSELTHIVFPLMDLKTENIQNYFELSYRTIEENLKKGAVLVHCGAGISRSATLVIAYYMKKYQSQFSTAIKFVRKIRPNICPNLGFELQLKKYQEDLGISGGEVQKKSIEYNKKSVVSNKKEFGESKQTLFDFSIPIHSEHRKPPRTSDSKHFGKTTTNSHRKSNALPAKKYDFTNNDLFICGKQANLDLKNQSMYQPSKYSIRTQNPLMGTWGSDKQKKESNGFKF